MEKIEIIKEISNNELCCHTMTFGTEPHSFHWHNKLEICRVLKGKCAFRIDGVLYEAEPGDILVIAELTVHQFIIEQDNTDICILQFPTKILLEISDVSLPIKAHIKLCEIKNCDRLEQNINSLFDILENERSAQNSDDNPFFKSTACALYLLLQRSFQCSDTYANKSEQQIFFKTVDFINAHFKENITLNSISENLFFSRGKISDIFKKYAGIGVNSYINSLRVKNANQLLNEGKSITEASLESGFQSIRTFNNVYKSIIGLTPSEYLKKQRKAR